MISFEAKASPDGKEKVSYVRLYITLTLVGAFIVSQALSHRY